MFVCLFLLCLFVVCLYVLFEQGLLKVIEDEDSTVLSEAVAMFDYAKKKFNWWDGVFTKRTVTELLFGYDDRLLSSLKNDLNHFSLFPSIRKIADSIDPRFNYSVSGQRVYGWDQ